MKTATIKVWREPIDDVMVAICVSAELATHGSLHGAYVFLLDEAAKHKDWKYGWDGVGRERLRHHIANQLGGKLPYIRKAPGR